VPRGSWLGGQPGGCSPERLGSGEMFGGGANDGGGSDNRSLVMKVWM
jgi:hypothetical protein